MSGCDLQIVVVSVSLSIKKYRDRRSNGLTFVFRESLCAASRSLSTTFTVNDGKGALMQPMATSQLGAFNSFHLHLIHDCLSLKHFAIVEIFATPIFPSFGNILHGSRSTCSAAKAKHVLRQGHIASSADMTSPCSCASFQKCVLFDCTASAYIPHRRTPW